MAEPDRPVTLALTGDVMLGRFVAEAIAERGYAYPWGNVLPFLHEADQVLVNLECALTGAYGTSVREALRIALPAIGDFRQ